MGLLSTWKRLTSRRAEQVFAETSVRPFESESTSRKYSYQAAELLTRYAGTVKVAASRNAMAIAGTPLRVYRKGGNSAFETTPVKRKDFNSCGRIARKAADTGDDVEELVDGEHPLVQQIERVCERLEDVGLWLGLCGNSYGWKGDAKPPETWFMLAPQFVHPVPDRTSVIGAYIYGRGHENERVFLADRIVHFRNPNPFGDPYVGAGDLQSCVAEADLAGKIVRFACAMMDNGAQPGLILTSESWVSEDQIKKARAEHDRMYAGPAKAGRSMFLGGKVNVIPWSMTEKELAFLKSGDWTEAMIAKCFDMPVSILRLESAALATAKETMPQWQAMAIRPRCQRIENILNAQLCPDYGPDLFVAFDDPVQREWMQNAAAASQLYTGEILTKNEARETVGYEPVDDGDEFYTPPANTGGGFGAANGGVDPGVEGGDGNDPEADSGAGSGSTSDGEQDGGKHDAGSGGGHRTLRIASGAILASSLIFTAPPAKACCVHPPHGQKSDDPIHAGELGLEAALRAFFRGITPAAIHSVTVQGELGFDIASTRPEFIRAVSGHLQRLYDAGASLGLQDVGAHADPVRTMRALTSGAREYLDTYNGKLFSSVSETLDKSIRSQLSEGIGKGETITELKDRVQETMKGATDWGAERIARTESSRAYLSAREEAWKASGAVKGKEWLLSADPCPLCQTIAAKHNKADVGNPFVALGQTIDLIGGGKFTCDFAAMDTPPAHPGCRCSTGMVLE